MCKDLRDSKSNKNMPKSSKEDSSKETSSEKETTHTHSGCGCGSY